MIVNDAAPLDILAAELGAVAGRIERETSLRIDAIIADLRRSDAERALEFAAIKSGFAELQRSVADRLLSLKDGAPGERGPQGERGEKGDAGATGERGPQGERGEKGDAGATGERGLDGKDGRDGQPGVPGRDGKNGERGDKGESGRDGRDAISPKVRGTYSESVTDYAELNIVALNGAAFIAKCDNPGPCPGDGWQVISTQGKTGKPGEGRSGPPGQRGPAGPAVERMEIDGQGMLTLHNADGSMVQCDLYPVLSKVM